MCVGIIQSIEGLTRIKRWKKRKFSLYAWAETWIFFCPQTSVVLVFGPSDSDQDFILSISHSQVFELWIIPLAFLVLQLADGRSWDFCNKFLLLSLSLYISHWFCFSGELWLIRVCFFGGGAVPSGIFLVPWPGIEPRPWQWKHWVLTTGPPGNSQYMFV